MSKHNHVPQVINFSDGRHQARCSCNSVSKIVDQKWEAEDWTISHLATVQRVRANLSSSSPSLKSQRDYYLQQANDTNNTRHDRDLWQLLADGLSSRLNEAGLDPALQMGLFEETGVARRGARMKGGA